ncbi:MAG TPA: helix-turn-helix domain-containing protein [Leptolyngbyaceae cyanobacterium M33_DOE_097]|uniref:Transposase n=1 Tax=Oscillatoriales cyanobacterium SpSt-418 TaxID=2282169 RepID=A0A7C3KIM3_9CYAN|nr:helix-turn-helix domain-containing protein [Leptolyngbyaceae cyanobacterium M33_DOE_097]
MSVRRLSESEKQQILDLYRSPSETTSTLASRFGVSNSTISRILKLGIPDDEYEILIQQKKRGATASTASFEDEVEELDAPDESNLDAPEPEESPANSVTPTIRRSRKRSSAKEEELAASIEPEENVEVLEPIVETPRTEFEAVQSDIEADLDDIEADLDDLDDDDLDDDLDDDDLDDDDLDDDDLGVAAPLLVSRDKQTAVQVLPFKEASIPRTCYLVVDRAAELVARPLGEFGDLGQIPEAEISEKTLPIFDNHRVAKRFSNPRTQRVIKLPDGKILQKTSPYLQAKGITRLLIDGQVYSLN